MDANSFLNNLTDVELLARMIYGEARGEPYEGMVAVANVAINRSRQPTWWGTTLHEVILHPGQFSCFNPNYREILIAPKESIWLDCVKIAHGIMASQFDDNTNSATHYYASSSDNPPYWAASMTQVAVIGGHLFFK